MLNIVGIDIGSALSLVVIDETGAVIHSSFQFHSGAISETLRLMLGNVDINTIGDLAMTHSGPDILRNIFRYDTQIAIIAVVRQHHRDVGSILFVGGENFGLITFNEEGDYERYRSNSSSTPVSPFP